MPSQSRIWAQFSLESTDWAEGTDIPPGLTAKADAGIPIISPTARTLATMVLTLLFFITIPPCI